MESKYFYTKETKTVPTGYGLMKNLFTVIKVNMIPGLNGDEAERKARTIAAERGTFLAGGYFSNPSVLNADYTVIDCPDDTVIQPYNDADKYIIALIEAESNMDFIIL